MATAYDRVISGQNTIDHRNYRDRGFLDASRYQNRSISTRITARKKTIKIVTGTISNRKTEKLPDGRTCISFIMNVPLHEGPHKIPMYATGSNMVAIMRHPTNGTISVIHKFNRESMKSEMTSVATEDEKSQDISGLWIIRQSDVELDDNLSRLRRSQTRLTCAKFMTGSMVIIRTPAGKTFPIPKALLTRP